MTTTTVSDAVILPQSQGTGLSGEDAVIDAAINGVLNRYVGGEYVASEYSTGLAFQNHDGTNDTVEVGPGIVFIKDNSTSTSGERGSGGNPQAESSTTSGYDTELPEGHTYAVLFPTATEISVSDSTLNEVYVDIDDVTANNSVNLEHDGSTTASPSSTSLKIGETNPDDASADTRANDDASPTYDSLTVNGTTDTDALNADSVTTDNSTITSEQSLEGSDVYESFGEFDSGRRYNLTDDFGDIDDNEQLRIRFSGGDSGHYLHLRFSGQRFSTAAFVDKLFHFRLSGDSFDALVSESRLLNEFVDAEISVTHTGSGGEFDLIIQHPSSTSSIFDRWGLDIVMARGRSQKGLTVVSEQIEAI